MEDGQNKYYSDDYSRKGCTYTLTVPANENHRSWTVKVFAPGNKYQIESYACSTINNALGLIKHMALGLKAPKNYHLLDKFG